MLLLDRRVVPWLPTLQVNGITVMKMQMQEALHHTARNIVQLNVSPKTTPLSPFTQPLASLGQLSEVTLGLQSDFQF